MINLILDVLFPKTCAGCKKSGSFFCKTCISEITQTDLVCPMCERSSLGGITHPICKRGWGIDGLWSLGIYDHPLKQAIQKVKYKWITELATDLTDLLIEYWARFNPILIDQIKKDRGENWLIIPVPLHKKRQNMRGFNQASLLGKLIAQKLGLPFEDALIRVKNTKPQFSLKSEDRRHNIKGAFELKKDKDVKDKKVLLIDDVWTTGATLKECSAILKRNKAKLVWGITIAR
jgi:competence protein ComFC